MKPRIGRSSLASAVFATSGVFSLMTGVFLYALSFTWTQNFQMSPYEISTTKFKWISEEKIKFQQKTAQIATAEIKANSPEKLLQREPSFAPAKKLNLLAHKKLVKKFNNTKQELVDTISTAQAKAEKQMQEEMGQLESVYDKITEEFSGAMALPRPQETELGPIDLFVEANPLEIEENIVTMSFLAEPIAIEEAVVVAAIATKAIVPAAKLTRAKLMLLTQNKQKSRILSEYSKKKNKTIAPSIKSTQEKIPLGNAVNGQTQNPAHRPVHQNDAVPPQNEVQPLYPEYDRMDKIHIYQAAPEIVQTLPPKENDIFGGASRLPNSKIINSTTQKPKISSISADPLAVNTHAGDQGEPIANTQQPASTQITVMSLGKTITLSGGQRTKVDIQKNIRVNTQNKGSDSLITTIPKEVASKDDLKSPPTKELAKTVATTPGEDIIKKEHYEFFEALENNVEIFSTEKVQLSRSWWVGKANQHLDTIYWNPPKSSGSYSSKQIPILSELKAYLLAKFLKLERHPETGIVFGKIAPGWSVRLSGRAEPPLIFSNKNELLEENQQLETERSFLYLNVEPGAQIAYVTKNADKKYPNGKMVMPLEGALGLPVMAGKVTYVDFKKIEVISVRGRVLDASAVEPKGLKMKEVAIIGKSQTEISNKDGVFKFENVLKISDYPILFETRAENGFTHRYSISTAESGDVALYRAPEKYVISWFSQLEGGISPESGFLFAAVPGPVSEHEPETLFPQTRPLIEGEKIKCETYTLSDSEREELLVHRALDERKVRFVATRMYEGPHLVELISRDGTRKWSDLVFASPRVINIVGPY